MKKSVRWWLMGLAVGLASCGSVQESVNDAAPPIASPDAGARAGDAPGPGMQDAESPRVATAVEDVMRLLAGRFDWRLSAPGCRRLHTDPPARLNPPSLMQ